MRQRRVWLGVVLLFGLSAGTLHSLQTTKDSVDRSRELVVLVHGMGRTPISMLPMAWALKRAGYEVMNWGYSSTCCTLAEIGGQLEARMAAEDVAQHATVHFVAHSLGSLVVRWLLVREGNTLPVGRVVMLAPPNQGSSLADRMAKRFSWALKPLPELQTDRASTARTLPVPSDVEIGIIAGQFDGKVSVAETHLDGERAHVVVPAHHSFLMLRDDVKQLTLQFLRTGGFGGATRAEAAHGKPND